MFDMVVFDVSREETMKQKRLRSSEYYDLILSCLLGQLLDVVLNKNALNYFHQVEDDNESRF